MRNRVSRVIAITAVVGCGYAADVQAQWPAPLDGRLTISINGAGQNPGGDVTLEGSSAFALFDEQAVVERRQTIEGTGGGLLDFGVGYRFARRVGIGFSRTSSLSASSEAALSGRLPDPDFYDRARSASLTITTLKRRESATHVSAIFHIPFVENLDFAFTIGPSFLRVTQDFAQMPTLASFSDPLQPSISLNSASIVRAEKSVVGFNIGGEATYMLLRNVGVGAILRYVRGSAEFDVEGDQRVNLTAGNAQIGLGIRLKF